MAVRDPLGLPWTTTLGAGHTADDPWSLPESAQVRQRAHLPGLTSSGEGQRAALGTRAARVAPGEHALGPRSAPQGPAEARDRGRELVCHGRRAPAARRWPPVAGETDDTEAPAAVGGASPLAPRGQAHAQTAPPWSARRLRVRALQGAARPAPRVRARVARAVTDLKAREARQPGTPVRPAEAAAPPAAAAILVPSRVAGRGHVTVRPETHAPGPQRAPHAGTRPGRARRSQGGRRRAARGLARGGDPAPRRRVVPAASGGGFAPRLADCARRRAVHRTRVIASATVPARRAARHRRGRPVEPRAARGGVEAVQRAARLAAGRGPTHRPLSWAARAADGEADDGEAAAGMAWQNAVAHHPAGQNVCSPDAVACNAQAPPGTAGDAAGHL